MAFKDEVGSLDRIAKAVEQISEGGGSSFSPTITSPQDGDTIVYNAATQKWVNGAGGGAGGGGAVHINVVYDELLEAPRFEKTWSEVVTIAETSLPYAVWYEQGVMFYILGWGQNSEQYFISVMAFAEGSLSTFRFACATENDYPVLQG